MTKIQLARAIKDHPPLAEAWADKTIQAAARKPKVKAARSQRGAAVARKAKRETRKAAIAEFRPKVFARNAGICQFGPCGYEATDMHHALSGPLRRKRESSSTCFALCDTHHIAAHRGDVDVLRDLRVYAHAWEMWDAESALLRRLSKITEARAQHPESRAANTVQPEPDREPTNAG